MANNNPASVTADVKSANTNSALCCRYPDCKSPVVTPAKACVPGLAALKNILKRPAKVDDLKDHVHCGKHAAAARSAGVNMYSYLGTVSELERRDRERETGNAYFSLYAPMKKAGLTRVK